MCTKCICKISIMQGQVKFKLQKLCIQVVSAGFPHFKSDVTTCFSCGNCTYAKFPNRFCMLHYLDSPSFSKFQSMETVWYSGQTSIPHCKMSWISKFQVWNYAETIRILKFQHSFSGVWAMLKLFFSFNEKNRWLVQFSQ